MEQPIEQRCYCDFRLCGQIRKTTLYNIFNNENIPYQNVKQVYITALKIFRIFSNLFDSQRVSTPIINKWTDVAVQCYHVKKKFLYSYIKSD